jgi:hypothetical protein
MGKQVTQSLAMGVLAEVSVVSVDISESRDADEGYIFRQL